MAFPSRSIARARDRGGSWYATRRAWRAELPRHREYVRGARELRRMLRQMPEAMRAEMLEMLDRGGDAILAQQRADVSRRTGATAQALSKRLSRATLRLRVGLIGKPVNRRLFYARIVQTGRRAQTVMVQRRGARQAYALRVKPRAARPFVHSSRTYRLRDTLGGTVGNYWGRVLSRSSASG